MILYSPYSNSPILIAFSLSLLPTSCVIVKLCLLLGALISLLSSFVHGSNFRLKFPGNRLSEGNLHAGSLLEGLCRTLVRK